MLHKYHANSVIFLVQSPRSDDAAQRQPEDRDILLKLLLEEGSMEETRPTPPKYSEFR